MSQNKILISFSAVLIIIVAVAIGFGKYKDHMDSQLLEKSIIHGHGEKALAELQGSISRLDISNEAKTIMSESLLKVLTAIKDLYTSDDNESNILSVKVLRCFYRELMYTQKEFQLDTYKLMPLKKSWDEIQYPRGASKTFLQKKIGRIGVAAKISNQFCFDQGLATKLRPEPRTNREGLKGLFNGLNILKRVL
ncbi:hypothetical protein ACRXCV_09435 [Halobacteriovorax sp. GFR7]|uniref:hypothetical protein n=1 Tax=unclassified Halobacteriovorax TaxID=2639665 RepID=UPI003D999A65